MRKNVFTCSFSIILLLFSAGLFAQNNPVAKWSKSPSGKYRCFTDEVDAWRKQNNTANSKTGFENWIKTQMLQSQNQQQAARVIPIIYNIPVIFHIVHSGEAAGTGTNIGATYINAQIQQLNNDFRKIAGTSGDNNHAYGADVQINFCAATLDTNNNALAEAGIQRINKGTFGATNPPFNITYIENTIKPNSIWDATRYLNVWVLDLNGLLGYAQFPDAPNELGVGVNNVANTDGVVVLYSSVGSSLQKFPGSNPYDEGRTLTHEVGHWLGLRHIWGDVDCTTDDFVFDTPRASAPNFGCPAPTTNSCNDITYGAAADSNDMVKNYMDYTDDACMNIFTNGQKARIRVVMGETGAGALRRAGLRLSDRCQSAPKVSFVLTDTTVMEKTNCVINWSYSIPVRISRAPNATTTVTLTQTTGTTDGNDISISPASVEFSAADLSDKYFTVTVNADAVMEGHEIAYLNLNASGSNATTAADSFELVMMNDDWPPFNGKRISATLLSEDFENTISGWIMNDYVTGNNTWVLGGNNGNMNGNKSAYISNDNSSLQYDAGSTSHSIFYKEIDAALYDSMTLSLWYKSYGEKTAGINYDYGKIVYSTDSISFHQLNGTTDLVDSSNMTYLSVQLPYFLSNRKFYIGFYWENDNVAGNDPPFTVDDITISGRRWMPSMIHTAVDTTATYDEKPVGPMQIVDFYDKITGDVLATVQDLGGYNWGCVKVEVNRAGTGAQWVTGDPQTTMQTKLFDKTYKVTPTNNNTTTGQYKITFYLTQAEVNGWQLASGNGLPIAKIIKYNGRINDMTYTSTFEQRNSTQAAYLGGSDWTISSTFNTGFSGFGFGNIPLVILPVQILSFTAKERNKTVDLKWRVENEQNLDHYTVMRSTDGRNFEPVGNLPARGANNGIAEYILNDPNPLRGKNYYQLVSYNMDGGFKKSTIVEVVIKNNYVYTVTPNPFSRQIKISSSGTVAEKISVTLTDIYGRRILYKPNLVSAGEITIDLPGLNTGVYLLQISDSEGIHISKLVKE